MKKIFYITYGEEKSTVYSTQVALLLKEWAKKSEWKVNCIQVAFSEKNLFEGVDVTLSYIARFSKWPFKRDRDHYIKEIKKIIGDETECPVYVITRGILASYICRPLLKMNMFNLLDLRGIPEENLTSYKTFFLYPVINHMLMQCLKEYENISVVSNSMREYVEWKSKRYKKNKHNYLINTTLSTAAFEENKEARSGEMGVFIGNFYWASERHIKKSIHKLLESNKQIKVIGANKQLISDSRIVYIDRVPPEELGTHIKDSSFGIIIRDRKLLNRVSAPSKVSDYLCAGLAVVYDGDIGSVNDYLSYDSIFSKCIFHVESLPEEVELSEHERSEIARKAQNYSSVDNVLGRYINFINNCTNDRECC